MISAVNLAAGRISQMAACAQNAVVAAVCVDCTIKLQGQHESMQPACEWTSQPVSVRGEGE